MLEGFQVLELRLHPIADCIYDKKSRPRELFKLLDKRLVFKIVLVERKIFSLYLHDFVLVSFLNTTLILVVQDISKELF